MNNNEFTATMKELIRKIEHPQGDELRIVFQYLMLDLEATRRERDMFHGMLEDMNDF